MTKPKIGILHYSCPPVIGGVESVIGSHVDLLTSHGYSVKIIAGEGERFNKEIALDKIALIRSQNKDVQDSLKNIKTNESEFNSIVDKISEKLTSSLKDIDICFIHNVLTMHFNLALSWALKNIAENDPKTRFINWVHDCTPVNPDYSEEASNKDYPWNILETKINNMKYVCISELRQKQASDLYGISPDKIDVIPNGIDIDSFLDLSPFASDVFIKENVSEYDIIAFTPTRILKRKNLELGVALVKSIITKGRSIKWMISGAPDPHNIKAVEYFNTIKELIKNNDLDKNIIFLSEKYNKDLSFDDIKGIYRISDILFFMSRQEGFGIPPLEAALCNIPSVCSNIPPLQAVGKDDVLYVKLENEDLDKKAIELISYLENRLEYRLNKRTIKTYPWQIIFKKKIEPLLN